MHGGLSPEMKSVEDIKIIKRPAIVEEPGIICDMLWSEPDINVEYWDVRSKGCSYTYGRKTLKSFLRRHDFDSICISKIYNPEGYEIIGNGQLISLFSSQSTFEDNIYGVIMNLTNLLTTLSTV